MRSRRLFSLPLTTLSVLFASVFLFGGTVQAQGIETPRPLSVNEQIILEQSQQVEQKATMLQGASQDIQTLEEQKQALADQLEAEKQKIEELKQKIAAKKAAEAKAEASRLASTQSAPPVYSGGGGSASTGGGLRSGCGDNSYAAYIYGQESGGRVTGMCNTTARNAGGCYGIGQACPGSKVAYCGADYACQNAWFNGYAIQRYGSWASAYSFHKANGWW